MMVMNDPSWWEQRGTHQAGIAGFCEILNFPAWHEHAHVQLSLQPVSELYFCLMIKCICVLCARWCSILWPHALCNPLGSSACGIFQACLLEGVAISYSKDLPQPGTELTDLTSPALAGGFFTMVPPGHILKKRAIFFFFWRFFWVFIEFVTTLLLFYVFWLQGMWDLISLNREQTHTLFALEGRVLTTGLSGKFQDNFAVIKAATVESKGQAIFLRKSLCDYLRLWAINDPGCLLSSDSYNPCRADFSRSSFLSLPWSHFLIWAHAPKRWVPAMDGWASGSS